MSTKTHNQILETRADDKLLKSLGKDVKEEMDTLTQDELKQILVVAHDSMKKAKSELEAHEGYQQAKVDVSAFSSGKRAVDKFQKAKIEYACARLEDMGKLVMHDKIYLDSALLTAKRELAKSRQERLKTEAKSGPVYSICLDCNKRKPCVCEKALGKEDPNALEQLVDTAQTGDMGNVTVSLNGGTSVPFKNLAKALREA